MVPEPKHNVFIYLLLILDFIPQTALANGFLTMFDTPPIPRNCRQPMVDANQTANMRASNGLQINLAEPHWN